MLRLSTPALRRASGATPRASRVGFAGRCSLSVGVAAIITGCTTWAALPARSQESNDAYVFVTEDAVPPTRREHIARTRGCDSVSVFWSGGQAFFGDSLVSPGRMGATSDLSVVLAARTSGIMEPYEAAGGSVHYEFCGSLYGWKRRGAEPFGWDTVCLLGEGDAADQWRLRFHDVSAVGGIAVTPDDRWVLVAAQSVGSYPCDPPANETLAIERGVAKYALDEIDWVGRARGAERGWLDVGAPVAEILVSRYGDVAHAITAPHLQSDGGARPQVVTFDIATMKEVAQRIDMAPIRYRDEYLAAACGNGIYWPIAVTHADLSADGRFVITNRLDSGELNVVDVVERRAWVVSTAGLTGTAGVAFNYREPRDDLVLVHGIDRVAVYGWRSSGLLDLRRVTEVDSPSYLVDANAEPYPANTRGQFASESGPLASVAWSGDGSRAFAAVGAVGPIEMRSWRVSADGRRLDPEQAYEACLKRDRNYLNDIFTTNHMVAPPTRTPTPTITPTATLSATASPSATAPSTGTPMPTGRPGRVYLPLSLRELACAPGRQRIDVALVIDASTSMRELTRNGRPKLVAATEAVAAFLDLLSLPLDQASIIEFNSEVRLLQELTGSRAALGKALSSIEVQRQTRIDLGVEIAHRELMSDRHRPGNERVMIVLTDGRANPVGPEAAVGRASAAKGDHITIFAIGLGEDLDGEALGNMASKTEYFYRTPDGEDVKAIYKAIAIEIPCPAEQYWGSR